jgi:hypothetical protein
MASGHSADSVSRARYGYAETREEAMAGRDAFKEASDLVSQALDIAKEAVTHEAAYAGAERKEEQPTPWVTAE